jgi:ATP-dependent RNA helicase RhlE
MGSARCSRQKARKKQVTILNFADLGLIPELLASVAAAGYTTPTPIQQQAITPALQGRDVLGGAQTGTGKTAAFLLPILQHIHRVAGPVPRLRALVLAPTRELASQIDGSLCTYGRHLDVRHTVILGGVKEGPQIAELRRGTDVLVATPGRLMDFLQRGLVRLDGVEVFVLDEADRMLDMGFIRDVRRIAAALPRRRQTLFFSATMSAMVRQLAKGLLSDPAHISVAPVSAPAPNIAQGLYITDRTAKPSLLVDVLSSEKCQRALVFSRTKHGANRVARSLCKRGIGAAAIHGNKSQSARSRALDGFRTGAVPVLVATDVAARGLDIQGITHVINYDLPNEPETYVHRIGRTARAGTAGVALSFCGPEERAYLAGIERLIGIRLQRMDRESEAGFSRPRPPAARPSQRPPRDLRAPLPTFAPGSTRGKRRAKIRDRAGADCGRTPPGSAAMGRNLRAGQA